MDASGATVGLFLLANLIGLLVGLWACFAKFKALLQFSLALVDSIDSTSYLPLLVHRLPAVGNQLLTLVS